MTPYYQDAYVTLYHADNLDILPTLPTQSFDLIITDPPYGFGKDFANDNLKGDAYETWCRRWLKECKRLAKQTFIFCGYGNLSMWAKIEKPAGIACWYKPGNFAGAGIFQFCHWEPILVYGKGRIGGPDVYKCSITRQPGLDGHPSPKPAQLFSEIIVRTKANTILDPFLGSGTTLAVAKALGRKAVGIEIEERYCQMALGRLLRTPLSAPLSAHVHHDSS